ncbi:MAG: hypothetical protein ABID40_03550, partial [Candidatus Bipolaricaulota bacterium]
FWAEVKAIAGCSGDGVPGIRGAGDRTAVKYLNGRLNVTTKVWGRIEAGRGMIQRNLRLVRLPFEGCPEVRLVEDRPTVEGWNAAMRELGIDSLTGMRIGRD